MKVEDIQDPKKKKSNKSNKKTSSTSNYCAPHMMNDDNDNDQPNQKRSLKKVRRSFLNRVRGQNGPPSDSDIDEFDSSIDDKIDIKASELDLVDNSNRTYIETNFLNPQLNIESIVIEDAAKSKLITFNFHTNKDSLLVPWEETSKKVKVYGDINLEVWAEQFHEYLASFPHFLDKYFKLLTSENQSTYADLRRAALKARITCKRIESEYPYRRFEFFTTESTVRLLSSSFSDRFIEQLGYSLEDITSWIKFNGVPVLFTSDSPINFGDSKDLFDTLMTQAEFIQEGPEYVMCCNDKSGINTCFVVQGIFISEPTPEGFFGTAYVILKGKAEQVQINRIEKSNKILQKDDIQLPQDGISPIKNEANII